ncbi:hypothetical protein WICPIJ_001690 [Wickerhamomyces pijperi]|uniref:Ribosomal RNA-processing protein 7 C-terminal domain-containing protein n=1 Tax=Wickerhamomyces pijperi TaxID=599730 RepID=A0A9P8TQD1_WICPI|nr:hypothetical protein WICPIJ_001690 [Wickerhamomyces pijperi]
MSVPQEIKGFQVVPVTLSPSKFLKTKEPVKHYMYIKKHQSNTDKELAEKSLFLVNPPLASTLSSMKTFFKSIAPESLIENYFLNDEDLDYQINLTKLTSELYDDEQDTKTNAFKLPNGCALVVFVDKSAANLAFTKIKKYSKSAKELIQWPEYQESASIRFAKMFQQDYLSTEAISERVSAALLDFDRREAEAQQNLKESRSLVDEDGFTLVVGKNRKTKMGILGKIAGTTEFHTAQNNKKMKKKEKADFYRFQIREKKKLEMNELLKKFKDDQERIKELKEKKRFRPY